MDWPKRFTDEMKVLLSGQGMELELSSFFAALEESSWRRAWRVNRSRIAPEEAARLMAAEFPEDGLEAADYLRPVPWSRDGYYIPEGARPGRSSVYRLGLIYIQEASAMLPAEMLSAEPGEMVLDLCAAPGGKSSQILTQLQGSGLLLANDISEARARVLQKNIEQQALEPCVVISADPQQDFPREWDGLFDAVQLDAPCSGEGMFRRDPQAKHSWASYGPDSIRQVQKALLQRAAELLKPGGRLVYSTCTFNLRENESLLAEFLAEHEDFRLAEPPPELRQVPGLRPGLCPSGSKAAFEYCRRIWPQDGWGEGHFAALLRKAGSEPAGLRARAAAEQRRIMSEESGRRAKGRGRGNGSDKVPDLPAARQALQAFLQNNFRDPAGWLARMSDLYELRLYRSWLYFLPRLSPVLHGVKILKSGTFLGELKAQKQGGYTLLPAHGWLLELAPGDLKQTLNLAFGSPEAEAVFGGQTLVLADTPAAQPTGPKADYLAILLGGFPLAWGRQNGRTVKNLYPRGWVRD